jgi:hypothetical protein
MFSVTLIEFLIFLRQFAIAAAGASAFWGFIFLLFAGNGNTNMWQAASRKLLWIFLPALILYGVIWGMLAVTLCVFCADAHEGMSLAPSTSELTNSMAGQFYFFIALMLIAGIGMLKFFVARKFFLVNLKWFYGASFIIISIILVYPWAGGESFRHAASSALHGWHSILTLGSVIVVDFLYLTLRGTERTLFAKIFPLITKGIWLGLGIDFLSSGLVFNEAFFVTNKLLFIQTLIGILIVNGVFLSGPLARSIIASKKTGGIIALSGAISLSAWISITALDGFRSITLNYIELAAFYLGFVMVILIVEKILNKTVVDKYSM